MIDSPQQAAARYGPASRDHLMPVLEERDLATGGVAGAAGCVAVGLDHRTGIAVDVAVEKVHHVGQGSLGQAEVDRASQAAGHIEGQGILGMGEVVEARQSQVRRVDL